MSGRRFRVQHRRLPGTKARRPARRVRARIIRWLLLAALLPGGVGHRASAAEDRLAVAATFERLVPNGVAETTDRRVFVDFPRIDPSQPNPSIAELGPNGAVLPWPGGAWNAWKPGSDPAHAFVSVNAIHAGPHGLLYVVDNGAVGFIGHAPVPGAAKIVALDPAKNAVVRVYPLGPDVLKPRSAPDDIRFHGERAYVTDAGAPGLIVLDLETGRARRVLDRDPSTTAQRPAIVDGAILRTPDGKPAAIHADQLEVSPDGRTLYMQPLPGPMYRLDTKLLDDPSTPPGALSKAVQFWYDTPSLGGTAIDSEGNLYLADLGTDSILRLAPDRKLGLVVRDPRLHWADALAFDGQGNLLVPVPQLDRTAAFNHGKTAIERPVAIYRIKVGAHAPDAR